MTFFDGSSYLIYLAGIAGLLHACLQLPLATLLHMARHTLGRDEPGRALALGLAMAFGVFLTVAGLLVIGLLIALALPDSSVRFMLAGILTTLSGLFIMMGYFHGQGGARLWFSRSYIRWFHKYIERRHDILSAFSLGNLAILLELGFSLPLLLAAGVLLSAADTQAVFTGFGLYAFLVAAPLFLVSISLTGGNNILHLQRWRTEARRFWQFFIGLAFILFGLYVASEQFAYAGAVL